VYQVSAWSQDVFVFYSNFSKCAKKTKNKKEKTNLNETLGTCISEMDAAIAFKFAM